MAKRASGRRARIGRKAAIRSLESLAASSATIQASTVSPRMESSLPGSAITREPFVSSSVKVLSASSAPPALMTASRTRRTASALWRCAGQATTLSEPGENKAACAIPQAAVLVLPHWRAVSARMEAPRGALKKSSCHFVGSTPRIWRTHSAGSIRYATSLRLFMIDLQKCLRDSSFQFWLVVEALDYALDDLREIEIDVGLHGDIDLRSDRAVVSRKPRQAIQRMSDRVKACNRDRERALLLCLSDNLVDPRLQFKIGVIQGLFRRQTGYRRGAARDLLHDGIRRG